MTDLATTYLGLPLKHPVVASAGPLSRTLDGIRQLEDGGAAAIVLFSLFEEQIRLENAATEHLIGVGAESFAEALDYFPAVEDYEVGPEPYLELIRRAREATAVPIIASLNGMTRGGLGRLRPEDRAGRRRGARAQRLLHPGRPHDDRRARWRSSTSTCCAAVKAAVRIPVAMKLNPFFSALGEMARQLVSSGADGLVLFNRFYQPDFDLEKLEVAPTLQLSRPDEIRLPLLWIAILHGRLEVSLAASTGVHSQDEVVKYLLAGADAVMTTSALLEHGPRHLDTLVSGLAAVAGAARLRLGRADERLDEPEERGRPDRLRARQLHQDPRIRFIRWRRLCARQAERPFLAAPVGPV